MRQDNLVFRMLKHKSNLATNLSDMGCRIEAIDLDSTAAWKEQTIEQARKRAFARTVGADDANPPFVQAKSKVRQNRAVISAERDAFKLD